MEKKNLIANRCCRKATKKKKATNENNETKKIH